MWEIGASEGIRTLSGVSALCVNVRLAATWKLCNSPDICTFPHRFTKALSQIVTKEHDLRVKKRGCIGLWITETAEAGQNKRQASTLSTLETFSRQDTDPIEPVARCQCIEFAGVSAEGG